MERARRLELAHEIAASIQHYYGDRVLAIGLYGSLARGTDGPYSDIEMHCVLWGSGAFPWLEWSAGDWKAEVDVFSEEGILARASEVDINWALTQGACTAVVALYDPTGFFARLRQTTLAHPDHVFRQAIRDIIVGEIYERIGKIRNARTEQHGACLPYLAIELAKEGAYLLGLANRCLYTTSTRLFEESLALPGLADGYTALCQIVMKGELGDMDQIADAADAFWSGIETWAQERDIRIEDQLETLLKGSAQ